MKEYKLLSDSHTNDKVKVVLNFSNYTSKEN